MTDSYFHRRGTSDEATQFYKLQLENAILLRTGIRTQDQSEFVCCYHSQNTRGRETDWDVLVLPIWGIICGD